MNTQQLLCGIELESEGYCMHGVSSYHWDFHDEGTLRGAHTEFVLKNPTSLGELDPALQELGEFISEYPVELTPRCGLHVHVDVRDLEHTQIYSACLTYALLERVLYKVSGGRSHSKFCVPVYKSAFVRNAISELYLTRHITTRGKLYSGLNLDSISRLGSIEFRMHKGTLDMDELKTWVTILHNLVSNGSQLSPETIIQAGQTYRSFSNFATEVLELPGLEEELDRLESRWSTYDTKIIEQIHLRALQLDNQQRN